MNSTTVLQRTFIALLIISAALNTLSQKMQNQQFVTEAGRPKYFFHPYMQAVLMFFGEAIALLILFVNKKKDPEQFIKRQKQAISNGKQMKYNKFLLLIPASADLIASTLQYIALNFLSGSVYQMMLGGRIATTFLYSILMLKMRPQRHHILGSIMALVGVAVVGASNLIFSQSGQQAQIDPGLQIMGYLLLILSFFTAGFQFTFEQKLLNKYHIEPLEMVGYEGIFGLGLELIILPIVTFIPCSFGEDACVFAANGQPFVERPEIFFQQLEQSGLLIFFCIFCIFSVTTFNVSGVSVTRYMNALTRAICDVSSTIIIWAVGLIITFTVGQNQENYQWESTDGRVISIQLCGFLILVVGNILYNGIYLPKWLLDEEEAINQNKVEALLRKQGTKHEINSSFIQQES